MHVAAQLKQLQKTARAATERSERLEAVVGRYKQAAEQAAEQLRRQQESVDGRIELRDELVTQTPQTRCGNVGGVWSATAYRGFGGVCSGARPRGSGVPRSRAARRWSHSTAG